MAKIAILSELIVFDYFKKHKPFYYFVYEKKRIYINYYMYIFSLYKQNVKFKSNILKKTNINLSNLFELYI
jgi:hypothetical protein